MKMSYQFQLNLTALYTLICRDQTEEWKGWMQVMFVWYHYFAAKETYNWIRVFIACYVWMTGFGQLLLLLLYCWNYSPPCVCCNLTIKAIICQNTKRTFTCTTYI